MAMSVPSLVPTPTPDDPRLGAWRSFIQANARLLRRLDDELQASHDLSLAEYDALLQLVNAPDRRLRMSVLAERVLLSRSGITRLVDRLVAAGMVERSACVTDARGAEAALTAKGLDTLRAASRTHLDGVNRYFLGPIGDADRDAIESGCNQVLDELGRDATSDTSCTLPRV
ncbi:MAG TPA: MarR family winged helix-turn-helix transcriptional regulator [Candidatus Limnocylindrales bacterium]|nr:MarR family winged helix-turn-helix transcriptional regulator [Candidatus Limnocylindrales bacterium]